MLQTHLLLICLSLLAFTAGNLQAAEHEEPSEDLLLVQLKDIISDNHAELWGLIQEIPKHGEGMQQQEVLHSMLWIAEEAKELPPSEIHRILGLRALELRVEALQRRIENGDMMPNEEAQLAARKLLEELFAAKIADRKRKIAILEQELTHMRESVERAEERKDAMVEARLKEVLSIDSDSVFEW